ncbi:hypothetical protein F4810DRAFT_704032 [Camillea tinctor]|nr:hypothetical protein F4810DRAFT_704032 [Camillea tinctor]
MPFEFINNNNPPNDATRKRIRSHAALGENKGKRISRPSRKDALRTIITSFRIPTVKEEASETTCKGLYVERPVDDGLFLSGLLPGESKGLVKKVISFMSSIRFSSELGNGLDYTGLSTPICVQYMIFTDAMATAISCLNNLVSKPEGVLQAMHHVSHTFRLVNQKLSSQSAVTDLTIGVIVSMAQYEQNQTQFQQGSVHVRGLRRITQLRGGMLELTTSSAGLVQKMLRVDLEYSLQLGSPTLFTVEEALVGCKTTTPFSSLYPSLVREVHTVILEQHQFKVLPENFRGLLMDMMFLATLLNNAISGVIPKVDATDFHKDIISLGYRLVKLEPLGLPLGTCSLQNKLHLGLTAFLTTFLQGWDGQIPHNELLSRKLFSEIQTPFLYEQQGSQGILLWLLFVGATSSGLWKHPAWVSITKHTLNDLEIENWEDVKKVLVRFPWVNAIHDAAGQALWRGANEGHSDDSLE